MSKGGSPGTGSHLGLFRRVREPEDHHCQQHEDALHGTRCYGRVGARTVLSKSAVGPAAHWEASLGPQDYASVSVVYGECAQVTHVVQDVQIHYAASEGRVGMLRIRILCVTAEVRRCISR